MKVHTIPPRDWARMSWHQKQRWINTYARTHRTGIDDDPPATTNTTCPDCGGTKGPRSATCLDCYRAQPTPILERIIREIEADPTITSPQLAARLDRNYTDTVYRVLRRNGRDDLAKQIKANTYAVSTQAGRQLTLQAKKEATA